MEDKRCNFCGKEEREVSKLIAGPIVFICNECIALCSEILDERDKPQEQEPMMLLDFVERMFPGKPIRKISMIQMVSTLQQFTKTSFRDPRPHAAYHTPADGGTTVPLEAQSASSESEEEEPVQGAQGYPASEKLRSAIGNLNAFCQGAYSGNTPPTMELILKTARRPETTHLAETILFQAKMSGYHNLSFSRDFTAVFVDRVPGVTGDAVIPHHVHIEEYARITFVCCMLFLCKLDLENLSVEQKGRVSIGGALLARVRIDHQSLASAVGCSHEEMLRSATLTIQLI